MKKFITTLIVTLLSLIMVFSTACTSEESTTESSSTGNTSEESTENLPSSVPEDEKDIGDDLFDILNPIFGNDFINVSIKFETDTNLGYTNFTSLDAYIKNTVDGYDAIINVTSHENDVVFGSEMYYIDGIAVYGEGGIVEDEHVDWIYTKEEYGTLDAVIDTFVDQIEMKNPDVYAMIETAFAEIKGLIADGDMTNIDQILRLDFEQSINDGINTVLSFEGVPVYDLILSFVISDGTDPTLIDNQLNAIYEYLATNPTLADVINAVIDSINEGVPEEEKFNLEATIDAIQAQIGMSTAEIVDYAKSISPEIDEYFRDAKKTESLYEYLDSYACILKVNMFSEMAFGEGVTMADAVREMIENSKAITFDQLFNNILNGLLNSVEDGTAYYGEDADYDEDVGYDGEDTSDVGTDYFGLIKSLAINFRKFTIEGSFKTDGVGRPTKMQLSLNVEYSYNEYESEPVEGGVYSNITVNVSYLKPAVVFEIPEDILLAFSQMKEQL